MNIVINEKGVRLRASDIEHVIKSNKYNCICCNEKMVFVNGSELRNCHFRHYPKSKCLINNDKEYIENKKSTFHYNWQKLFPNQNIEIYFNENDKKHIADIYLENANNNDKLVIEIQHSPISHDKILERTNFYKQNGRELLWIFDIENNFGIEKIVTHDVNNTIIKFKNKIYFDTIPTELLLLDDGGEFLYKINPIVDADKELFIIKEFINKKIFIQNLKNKYNIQIVEPLFTNTNIINYDFENIIDNLNIQISSQDKLRIIISLFTKINKPCYNFQLLIKTFATLSSKNKILYDMIYLWFKNRYFNNNLIIKFGKYEDEEYDNFNNRKLKQWYVENINCDCCYYDNTKKCNKCEVLINCKIDLLNYYFFKTENIDNLEIYKCMDELNNNILYNGHDPTLSTNIKNKKSQIIFKPSYNIELYNLIECKLLNLNSCIFCKYETIIKIFKKKFGICYKCLNDNKNNIDSFNTKIIDIQFTIQQEKILQEIKYKQEREEIEKIEYAIQEQKLLKQEMQEKEKKEMQEKEKNKNEIIIVNKKTKTQYTTYNIFDYI
jgi:hypothetical protein